MVNKTNVLTIAQLKDEIASFSQFIRTITMNNMIAFEHEFHKRLNRINSMSELYPEMRAELMKYFYDVCGDVLDKSHMINKSKHKPLGYAGDFMTIDNIYTQKNGSTGIGKVWDDFYHRQVAPRSVRNRKSFFTYVFNELCYRKQRPISVLDIACGPCRDVDETLKNAGIKAYGSYFHCIDMDERAISYAQDMVKGHTAMITFKWEVINAFKLRTHEHYDLVWSAGLFDYLNDRLATALIHRMWKWTKEGGRLIVGNFHPRNKSRNFMEWCGEWFLIHRTEEDIKRIFMDAGVPENKFDVDREPLGACIFGIAYK
ncbi:MAG: class I SAM-dependent methyltransferase [Candidatus Omnitrophica bacterium]|nr:class I SAM-dependent methyltransferase [Candidatus Omnitrophota bacterium]